MKGMTILAGAAFALAGTPAAAQTLEEAFTGPSAGLETGYLEHHFALEFEETDDRGNVTERFGRYYRSHGVGGGAFAGYDVAVSPRARLGIELGAQAGGRTNSALSGEYQKRPRYGARATVRAGYLLTPRLIGYALAGYGGNRYRIRDTIGIDDGGAEWGSSFVVGAGAEYRLSRRVGARLQLGHTDNQTWSVFAGIPIRF